MKASWQWWVRQKMRWLGTPGRIGLAALALAGGFTLHGELVRAPERAALEARRAELDAAVRAAAPPPLALPAPVEQTPRLPDDPALAAVLADLTRMARQAGITLPRGQYRAQPLAGSGRVRWQIVLPVNAPYPALMTWLAEALDAYPHLILESFRIARPQIESTRLDAELRLALVLEPAP